MKKTIVFIMCALLCALAVGCTAPTGGTVPPVITTPIWHIAFRYVRPMNDVPGDLNTRPYHLLATNGGSKIDEVTMGNQQKISAYEFAGRFSQGVADGVSFCITSSDPARRNDWDSGSEWVGAKYYLEIEETGSTLDITEAMQNTIQNLPTTSGSKMSRLFDIIDGKLIKRGEW